MPILSYTLLTDPAPLAASGPGPSPSTATVYLVATNDEDTDVNWSFIDVEVPLGDSADDLTPNTTQIIAAGLCKGVTPPQATPVSVQRTTNSTFRCVPGAGGGILRPSEHLVLTLENITVAKEAGLAVLTVTEKVGIPRLFNPRERNAVVALVKTARAPRDFHPDRDIVEAGTKIKLSWEGSADFTYEIVFPGGRKPGPSGPPTGSQGRYTVSLEAADAPKRDTTYTLLATSTRTKQQHVLTTTVQVRDPIVDKLTTTTFEMRDLTIDKLTVTTSINADTVTAVKATITDGISTRWVQGRSTDDGWISFPKGGLNVYRDGTQTWGIVSADKADLNGVNAKWVQGRGDRDGWISFSYYGVNVMRHEEGGTGSTWGGVGVKWVAQH
jgi:hypothetical protein